MIFDRDAKKILNKSTRDLAEKKNWGTSYLNYFKTIDIREKSHMIWRKFWEKKLFSYFKEKKRMTLKIYIVAKTFYAPSYDKKGMEENIYIHNPMCYINYFATLFQN